MSAPLKVVSHKRKYRIIALKYEGELEYRYIIATDASWLDIDIIKAYSFKRWERCLSGQITHMYRG